MARSQHCRWAHQELETNLITNLYHSGNYHPQSCIKNVFLGQKKKKKLCCLWHSRQPQEFLFMIDSSFWLFFFFCSFLYSFQQGRQWQPTPVLLPGKSHGQRSLVGCSPWGREESDTTERLHFHFSLSCIGEGNGSLLQYSCLENPRDSGAWWAAVLRGRTESDTTEVT